MAGFPRPRSIRSLFPRSTRSLFPRKTKMLSQTSAAAAMLVALVGLSQQPHQVVASDAAGKAYLAENAKKPGVVVLPSGLQVHTTPPLLHPTTP
jgi:FKBP-type peptidyl-prolyl cis-trans isomerase